jgi:hypothetical protein
MSGLYERRIINLEEELVRLRLQLKRQEDDTYLETLSKAITYTNATERGDGLDEEDDGESHLQNTTMESDRTRESAFHELVASNLARLTSRIGILEGYPTPTTIAITGVVSKLWSERHLVVAISAIYDECKAKSWGIENLALRGAYGKQFYTSNERSMYAGTEYHKIHGQRNPSVTSSEFLGPGREGVGYGDLQYILSSAVDRFETCPRRLRMHMGVLKMKNGVTFATLQNLGGTEPSATHFHPETKMIRYFDVEHKEGTVGSFTNKVISKGPLGPGFALVEAVIDFASLGIVIALKRGGIDLEGTYTKVSDGFNQLVKSGGGLSDYFNVSTLDTSWIHVDSTKHALTRIQDAAAEDYGGPFPLAYEVEKDGFLGRGARVGCRSNLSLAVGDYSHGTIISTSGLNKLTSFKNHTHHGKTIDNGFVSYTPREEYNTTLYQADKAHSKFGFDTLEYEFRGVNTGLDMFVDAAGSLWRSATPTRTEYADGEGDALTMDGRLFAVYDYGTTTWRWVKGDTSLIS